MTSKNDITGDNIISKCASDAYRNGWDLIFGTKKSITSNDQEKETSDTPDKQNGLNTDTSP